MTKTDAFLFAIRKMLDQQRQFIDTCDVKSIQLTVALNRDGQANVVMNQRTEDVVLGCFQGNSRNDRYAFAPEK